MLKIYMCTIQTILNAKISMERCEEKNKDFVNIIKQIDKYLYKHCKHEIVKDSIDIDDDRSKTIYYCEKCELTFSNDVLEEDDSTSDGSDAWVEWYYGPTDLNTFGPTT